MTILKSLRDVKPAERCYGCTVPGNWYAGSAHSLGQCSGAPGRALKMESACSSGDSELGDEKSQLVQRVAAPIAVMFTPELGRKRVVEAEVLLRVAVPSGTLLAHHASDCGAEAT